MNFLGYPRPDGSAGIRNHVLVIPWGFVAAKICELVDGTKTLLTADSGSGRTSRDRETIARTLIGLGRNPNVASVIVHTLSPGAGYPELKPSRLVEEIAKSGKRVEILDVAREGSTLRAVEKGAQLAREMVVEASNIRRQPFDLSSLAVGVKCGHSDTTSGLAGNPVIGNLFDRIVAGGGTAFFGETTEIIGAEHVLAKRAINDEVSRQILEAADRIEAIAKSTGEDIRTVNPVPSNIAGGISSLEEKSLGAIHKSGSSRIQGVLKYGERPEGKCRKELGSDDDTRRIYGQAPGTRGAFSFFGSGSTSSQDAGPVPGRAPGAVGIGTAGDVGCHGDVFVDALSEQGGGGPVHRAGR